MLASQRKQQILQIPPRKTGDVRELSQRFNVSEDPFAAICELAAEGKLQRVHGGHCRYPPLRQLKRAAAQIASDGGGRRAAAALDPAGTGGDCRWRHHHRGDDRLLPADQLHGGHRCARHAVALVDHRESRILPGGRVFKHSVVAVGARRWRNGADQRPIRLYGVIGVHPRAGFTTGDYEEAGIKRALTAGRQKPW